MFSSSNYDRSEIHSHGSISNPACFRDRRRPLVLISNPACLRQAPPPGCLFSLLFLPEFSSSHGVSDFMEMSELSGCIVINA